jgi:hypothetical protein
LSSSAEGVAQLAEVAAEESGRTEQAVVRRRHLRSLAGEESCRTADLAADTVDVDPVQAGRRTAGQDLAEEDVCHVVCTCQDDHIDLPQAVGRTERPAYHQGQRQRVLHFE